MIFGNSSTWEKPYPFFLSFYPALLFIFIFIFSENLLQVHPALLLSFLTRLIAYPSPLLESQNPYPISAHPIRLSKPLSPPFGPHQQLPIPHFHSMPSDLSSPPLIMASSLHNPSETPPSSDTGSDSGGFLSGDDEFDKDRLADDGGILEGRSFVTPPQNNAANFVDDEQGGVGDFQGGPGPATNSHESLIAQENHVRPTPQFGAEEVGVKASESKSVEGLEEQPHDISGTFNLNPPSDQVVNGEGVKFTGEGVVVVDTIDVNVDVNGAIAAVGADVEESKESEVREVEVPTVDLNNGFTNLEQAHTEDGLNVSDDESLKKVAENSAPIADAGDVEDEFDIGAKAEGKILNGTNPIAETVDVEDDSDKAAEVHVAENGSTKILEDLGGDDGGVTAGSQNGNLAGHPSDETAEMVSIPKADESPVYQDLEDEEGDIEGSGSDGETERMIFESPEAAKKFLEQLEQGSGGSSLAGVQGGRNSSQTLDGQVETDSEEEVDTDEEGEGKELFDSAALTALLRAATGSSSDNGNITITSQDGSRLFSVERPAGLGSSLPNAKPVPRSNRPSLFTSLAPRREVDENLSEDDKRKLEKLQELRVKFLRLVHRLGHSPEDAVAAQVLYRVTLVAGRQTSELFNLDSAKRKSLELEAAGDELDFSLNILVLGKTGVGKSATINSIFGEEKARIHAFEPATSSVKEIIGTIDGVRVRVIDTPGLKASAMEQGDNRRILASVKKFTKNCPPDIVLYVDRLDSQTRDLNDMPLLKSITASLGSSIWRNAIVTLTHAASAPPDGPSGSPLSYEVFVAQRSHVVQQSIGHAVGDLRLMSPSLMNPVSLVENHPSCRKNRDGQKVLPNGQTWRPQLLLLSYSMKILAEGSSLSKPQDPFDHRKLFGFRVRSPPLPYLLSWLLQSRAHPKLAADQGGENGDSDIDMADLSDSDIEDEEDEYDQLPPFKPLRKAQLAKLSKEQRKAYFEEYDYRVKLFQKKQWREEVRRVKEMKKKGKSVKDEYIAGEDAEQENEGPAAVPVPLPDMVLPPSFDASNPAYRYRFLEPTSQFLARPVLDTHGWDHDCGYDGVNVEQGLALAGRFPASIAVQLTKDKKEFNIHLDSSIAAKHGEKGSTMAGFDIQNVGKQLAYILRGETKFNNFRKHKAAAGFSVTFLGENVVPGFKVEDQISVGKRLVLVGSTGTVRSQGDAAYGANLEVRLREADFPVGQDQSSLGLSLVKWRGDLALGANLQSQISVGRSSKVTVRAGLNNKMSGQLTVRTSSSDQVQIALMAVLPFVMAIYKTIRPGVSDNYTMY